MRLSGLRVLVASCWLASCGSPESLRPHHHPAPPPEEVDDSDDGGSGWEPMPRWIVTGDLQNARDVGGVPLRAGASVAHGALFRGPPLAPLTAAGCDELHGLGIRTVIDLRMDFEREGAPEASCVSDLANIVSAPLPVPYSVSASDYIADLDTFGSIATAFDVLGDPAAYPIYIHCTWGRDRTGVVIAVILRALGAARADIMQEYLLSSASVGAYPESLAGMLDEIEARGGIARYLDGAGVTSEQVAALRDVLQKSP